MISMPIEPFVRRRTQLLAKLGANSIAIIPAAAEKIRSRDTEYHFRQDSYFYYLSGFCEPDALLVLKSGRAPQSILFCRDKDRQAEIWQGRRLGAEQAKALLWVDAAYPLSELPTRMPELISGCSQLWYSEGLYPEWDQTVSAWLAQLRSASKQGLQVPHSRHDLRPLLDDMRLIKDADEIALMREACRVSAAAHVRAMEKAHPEQFEYQLEAEIVHEFMRHGARFPAYNTIVGAGDNACILHYTQNQDVMSAGELVLIDAGCEYAGYAGDITRTFPVNGQFTEPQQQLYQLVLDAQYAALAEMKPGSCFDKANQAAIRVMISGLLTLGILHGDLDALIESGAQRPYFMHGIGHWLGLDVHDVGDYHMSNKKATRPFEPGMVLTVEPGIYIDESAEVDAKWHNIGIRIEDNILITSQGHEILTSDAPKEIKAIEWLMAQAQARHGVAAV